MTALYIIANEYKSAAQKLYDMDLDEQALEDTLESIGGEIEVKAQNVAYMVRGLEAEAAAVAEWAKAANERSRVIAKRAERLKDYLAGNMLIAGIEKITGPGVALSFRSSSAVVIDEPALIPVEFMRRKPPPEPEPDKTAIAAAIKAGQDVQGARLEHRKNLQIK